MKVDLSKKYKAKPPKLAKKLIEACKQAVGSTVAMTILKGSWVVDCSLCEGDKKQVVGVIHYKRYNGQTRMETKGVHTCFGGMICSNCEDAIAKKRNSFPTLVTPAEAKLKRLYKKFLEGKLWPEIVCVHVVGKWRTWKKTGFKTGYYVEGERKGEVVVATARLKSNKLYTG